MSKKETIYIDVDDDITSIIDKVKSSPQQIVALVLPKRASVLQSSVNMKLLKRTADQAKKNPVLITSEPALMPLAAASKVHVAPNLQAAPEIPPMPKEEPELPEDEPQEEVQLDPATPVGEAMGPEPAKPAEPRKAATPLKSPAAKDAKKSSRKPNVPNFRRFRKWIILGAIGLALLVAFLIWALFFAPKATVTVQTETSDLPKSLNFIADTEADSVNLDSATLPAISEQIEKTDTEKAPATGQENKGKKASGSVTMTATECAPNLGKPGPVASGTSLSYNGVAFTTQSTTTFGSTPTSASGSCATYSSSGPTKIQAQSPGTDANVSNGSFSVSGRSDISAQGSASGGTDNVVKVVNQSDIDSAKELLKARQDDATNDLKKALQEKGYVPIPETLTNEQQFTESAKAGTEASEVSVVANTKYSMLGVKEDDLKELINKSVEGDINTDTQTVLQFGIGQAQFKVEKPASSGQVSVNMSTTLLIGPDLKLEEIKSQIAGKSRDEATEILKQRPGFSDSTVETSPFWVKNVPGDIEKIEIIIEKPDGTKITQ